MDEAVECIRAMLKLIDDGDLIRNMNRDSDVTYFLRQDVRISKTLKEGAEIVEAWDRAKRAVP